VASEPVDTAAPLPGKIIDAHNHPRGDDSAELIERMDQCRVETALVMATPGLSNQQMLRSVRAHPGRLIGGVYVDPRDGQQAIDEVRRYHAEGVRVVKLFPNYGYYPDDESLRPFFDAVAELGMAVLSHCGWLAVKDVPVAAYYSHPGRFEKLIRLYPDTIFIMAHMGGIAGFLESVMLTTRTPNTFVDCSPGQGLWVLEATGAMAASIPPEKILWGADSVELAQNLRRYRAALATLGFGQHFEKIFYSNARVIFERIGALPAAAGPARPDG